MAPLVVVRMQANLEGESARGRALDLRLDILLYGAAPAVRSRIAALNASASAEGVAPARGNRFPDEQIYAMSNAWLVACAIGSSIIGGTPSHVRTCAVTLQHCVENWLTDRLGDHSRGRAPFAVVAAIHTPAPASPLRLRVDAAEPGTLLAPHLRDDTSVQGTVLRRADSLRRLLDAGATLHVCYSAASLDTMSLAEREVYQSTCAAYPDTLIDAPSALPPTAFHASCGATYLFGTNAQSLTGCFAIRLPQAADAVQGASRADLVVASPMDPMFKPVLDELKLKFGLELDPTYGGTATRALFDEVEYA
jgi:hypothetical protein